jgi:hypothetical protein
MKLHRPAGMNRQQTGRTQDRKNPSANRNHFFAGFARRNFIDKDNNDKKCATLND